MKENTKVKEQFNELYAKWYNSTYLYSRSNYICNNEYFKQIIEMDINAVPYIIEKLKEGKHSYFLVEALQQICPDVIICEGYISLEDLAHAWIYAYDSLIENSSSSDASSISSIM